jgi:hypothetical protein
VVIPSLARRILACSLALLVVPGTLSLEAAPASPSTHHKPGPYVLPCNGITLSASYLAEAATGQGPGFLFRIENYTAHAIRLARPVPSSAHWYGRVGNRWLWRASAGRGGALVNALNERGPMFAGIPAAGTDPPAILTVAARGSAEWTEPMLNNPTIAYRPTCPQCNYPGESDYQAVFAYAYLPDPKDSKADLLRCGLRSAPVPMPPHATVPAQ